MKSVIMIAYHFPPEGNAGAYRPLRFVRNLPKFGWLPRVISLSAKCYERYDPQLLTSVPPDTEVIRVANNDPWQSFQHWRAMRMQQALAGGPTRKTGRVNAGHQSPFRASIREMVRQAEAWIYHPDPEVGWVRPALKATVKSCFDKAPDVIWATAGPVSSFIVAKEASQRTRIPYVLDFRDAWTITYNEFEERCPAWVKRSVERSMYDLLENAQSIIFRYHTEAECFWRAYEGALDPAKVHIIPNGFEGKVEEFVPLQTGRCELLYTGTVSDYRYDTLLKALVCLRESSPDIGNRLHLLFVGEGAEAVAKDAAALDVAHMITIQGPTSHDEVNKLTKQSHALLILGRYPGMRGYELFAGAKLFGYLKAGMPIIGVLPSDETRKVLLRVGVRTVADVDSSAEIAGVLRDLVIAWSQQKLLTLLPDRTACENYSAQHQTEELVRALEGVPAVESFVPGSVEVPPSLRSLVSERSRQFDRGKFPTRTRDAITRPLT
jgi:hypothetical protein